MLNKFQFNRSQFNQTNILFDSISYSGELLLTELDCPILFDADFFDGSVSEVDLTIESKPLKCGKQSWLLNKLQFNSTFIPCPILFDVDFFDGSVSEVDLDCPILFDADFFDGSNNFTLLTTSSKSTGGGYSEILTSSKRTVSVKVTRQNHTWTDTKEIETITFEKINIIGRFIKLDVTAINVIAKLKPCPKIEIKIK